MFDIPTVNIKATGENIVKLRKDAGLFVKDIQNACGFGTPQAVYKWQQGLALPTVDNLLVLSCLFGVTIDEILLLIKVIKCRKVLEHKVRGNPAMPMLNTEGLKWRTKNFRWQNTIWNGS